MRHAAVEKQIEPNEMIEKVLICFGKNQNYYYIIVFLLLVFIVIFYSGDFHLESEKIEGGFRGKKS